MRVNEHRFPASAHEVARPSHIRWGSIHSGSIHSGSIRSGSNSSPPLGIAAGLLVLLCSGVWGQFGDPSLQAVPELGKARSEQWKVGVKISAPNGNCTGLLATIPVPTDWPEQSVRVINEEMTPHIRNVKYRMIDGGVKQMVVSVPLIRRGETATALLTLEVDRRPVTAPEQTEGLRIPRRVPRDLKRHLGPSPQIESRHREIRQLARELVDSSLTPWQQVEAFYDWVRENVTYENGDLKGALAALRDKSGDCEELTSLFIALCRNHGVPARTVWIPGHCYPEFYLEDESGEGRWYPCQAAGTRMFGSMSEARPILQKGDNFNVPEKDGRQRYVSEFLTGKARGGSKPSVEFIRESIPLP